MESTKIMIPRNLAFNIEESKKNYGENITYTNVGYVIQGVIDRYLATKSEPISPELDNKLVIIVTQALLEGYEVELTPKQQMAQQYLEAVRLSKELAPDEVLMAQYASKSETIKLMDELFNLGITEEVIHYQNTAPVEEVEEKGLGQPLVQTQVQTPVPMQAPPVQGRSSNAPTPWIERD
ncbi:hypothetical protein CEW46_21230 [Bacillus cereus]|nr:hypothetical protein CEW46_21230 [Bacillus cereus]